jgi:hypothetical protein
VDPAKNLNADQDTDPDLDHIPSTKKASEKKIEGIFHILPGNYSPKGEKRFYNGNLNVIVPT